MTDNGICPWCQTLQEFTFYGRQQCQSCGKPIRVTATTGDGDKTSQRLAILQRKQQQLQEILDFLGEGLELGLRKYAEELQKDIDNFR